MNTMIFFFLLIPRPPIYTLFPYTTLFRSLSRGVVSSDCITCPYHGWHFDGAGRCVQIPSLGASAHLPDHGVRAYPVRRSEEHTSELQSRRDLVCRLLLEKKKKSTGSECEL